MKQKQDSLSDCVAIVGNDGVGEDSVIARKCEALTKQSSKNGEAIKKVNQLNEKALSLDCHVANAPRNDVLSKRTPNLTPQIVQKIADELDLRFVSDHEEDEFANGEAVIPCYDTVSSKTKGLDSVLQRSDEVEDTVAEPVEAYPYPIGTSTSSVTDNKPTLNPLDILDYIYAILHSPNYRETYKEFLKIDFPKVPYPTDKQQFWELVKLGREIRLYHLLEHPNLANCDISYPIAGDGMITTKIATKDFIVDKSGTHGKIMINDTQYFDSIPIIAWNFYIGGYQPAQKWLKDRHGRKLSYDDITHYQKIIKALYETYNIMNKIDFYFKL